jgi:transcriptional regulator with XRE-family HTH domain
MDTPAETPFSPIRAWRERQNPPVTQQELADRIGASRVALWRWETGRRLPDGDDLSKISSVTGIAIGELRPDLVALLQRGAAE